MITRADKGSDHRLVRLKITVNKRLARAKAIHKLKPLNMNLNVLNPLSTIFQLNIKKSFEVLNSIDADKFCKIMKEEAEKHAGGRKIENRIDSKEDNDIRENIEKQRKQIQYRKSRIC